ncbi:MAG TPA: hypothetical protein VJM34_10240, partial [Novosphingobium sp.]|nr:hypothetical protein [Novosphingobium sp.]
PKRRGLLFPGHRESTILASEVKMTKRKQTTEFVIGSISQAKPKKVTYRRTTKDGRVVQMRVLDTDSPDFTAQLTDAFRSNVRRARAENRQLQDN